MAQEEKLEAEFLAQEKEKQAQFLDANRKVAPVNVKPAHNFLRKGKKISSAPRSQLKRNKTPSGVRPKTTENKIQLKKQQPSKLSEENSLFSDKKRV